MTCWPSGREAKSGRSPGGQGGFVQPSSENGWGLPWRHSGHVKVTLGVQLGKDLRYWKVPFMRPEVKAGARVDGDPRWWQGLGGEAFGLQRQRVGGCLTTPWATKGSGTGPSRKPGGATVITFELPGHVPRSDGEGQRQCVTVAGVFTPILLVRPP